MLCLHVESSSIVETNQERTLIQAAHTSRFWDSVNSYYDVVQLKKQVTQTLKSVYCNVSKLRFPSKAVMAAHIVPKSLQLDELSYFAGDGDNDHQPKKW